MRISSLLALLCGAILAVGCATVPRDRGAAEVNELLTARGAPAAAFSGDAPAPGTLTLQAAVETAFVRSPVIQEQYAELGLGAADVLDAVKLPDVGLGFSRLRSDHGDPPTVTRSASLAVADLLLMRSRTKVASVNFEGTRDRVAARLLDLQADVESAWYGYVAALQSAELSRTAARTARASAAYATRLHEAGNLPPRALAQELADASSCEIAAARAEVHAIESRAKLSALLGLPVRDAWRVEPRLPAPPHHDELPADLAERALANRLDLAAARREEQAMRSMVSAARTWRWLGDFEVGYERERDPHDGVIAGPTFHLSIPLLSWNRGGVLRARSALDAARSRLAAQELAVRNEVSLGLDKLATARRIAEVYRAMLVPQREQVYARTLEEVNFMLAGAFEALNARREQFEAGQEYIDAVRDYWLARVELRRSSGGALAAAPSTESLQTDAPGDAAHAAGEHR
jgi:cobalt-zinc-cadmium efflux system outer membrane protein